MGLRASLLAIFFCALSRPQTVRPDTDATKPCIEPPPTVRWQDYDGPFEKLVGAFGQTLERESVRQPHFRPGTVLCSLELRDKFLLFVHDSSEPISFLAAGFSAAVDQAENNDPKFGQGAQGYSRRFGADLADQTSMRFFGQFAYPAIFAEDPRYYRLGHGTKRARLLHAMGHTFIGHRDSGDPIFNYSEWLAAGSAVALGSTYHTSGDHGVGALARSAGYLIAQGFGLDIVREFWPEIAHKCKMPFRDMRETQK